MIQHSNYRSELTYCLEFYWQLEQDVERSRQLEREVTEMEIANSSLMEHVNELERVRKAQSQQLRARSMHGSTSVSTGDYERQKTSSSSSMPSNNTRLSEQVSNKQWLGTKQSTDVETQLGQRQLQENLQSLSESESVSAAVQAKDKGVAQANRSGSTAALDDNIIVLSHVADGAGFGHSPKSSPMPSQYLLLGL